jgi:VWFA-related protein
VLLGALLLAAMGWAQSPAPASPADTATIHVDAQLVLLDAIVENKKSGQPVEALAANDFALTEDGAPQTISYCSRDRLPLSVVLLFDMTETVHAALVPLARAAEQTLAHLKPEDEVAVMIFSSRTELLQDFTKDRALAASAIKTASWMADVEGTFLDEDMFEAVAQAMKARSPGKRRVLLWLTDGTANQQNSMNQAMIGQHSPRHLHSQQDAMTSLLQSGAVVSALIDRTMETNRAIAQSSMGGSETRLGDIDQYAKATGGVVMDVNTRDAADRLALLIDRMRARYTLGFKPAGAVPPGKFAKLNLQLSPEYLRDHHEVRKSDFVVLTKSGYYR